MKVILTKDVDSLGDSGEVFTVSEGYARNYLFPKNLAITATDGSMADLQRRMERVKVKADQKNEENKSKAKKVEDLEKLKLEANAGDSGKLFGSITTKDLSKVLLEKTGLEIERKQINVNAPINMVGEYEVYVKFSNRVTATLPLEVVPTMSEEQMSIIQELDEAEAKAEAEAAALATEYDEEA